MKKVLFLSCMLLIASPALAKGQWSKGAKGGWSQGHWVDLTYQFDSKTTYWPTEKGFELMPLNKGKTEQGYWYESNKFTAPEHGGTHLDAPVHFAKGKWTTDQVPLQSLVGWGAVIDVSKNAAKNADYLVSTEDIWNWEKQNGPLMEGSIVLIHTGWGRYWGNKKKYLGTDKWGDTANLHFPGLSGDAAKLLVERKVKAVGIDTASIDYGPSKDFIAHQTLLGKNIPVFENVAGLNKLPPMGVKITALPMKIKGGSGGPLRIIAELPQK